MNEHFAHLARIYGIPPATAEHIFSECLKMAAQKVQDKAAQVATSNSHRGRLNQQASFAVEMLDAAKADILAIDTSKE